MSAIDAYLEQLERELRLKRAPRGRLLAEAEDHLRASADEIAAAGAAREAAEEEAVARFGAAAVVARRFAHAVASTSARTALVWGATAAAGYAIAAGSFIVAAPSWLRDFPQGAPSMVALQVAAVALALSALRARQYRTTLLIDELRLRLIGNGVLVATAVLVGAAAVELLLALTRPAPAPWGDAANVIATYAVGATAALLATFAAAAAAARASLLAALPRGSEDALAPVVAALADDVAAAAPPLRPVAVLLTSRPRLAWTATAVVVFTVMTSVALADPNDETGLVGAAATGLFEAAAVVVAYLTLGRALGLREPRRGAAG